MADDDQTQADEEAAQQARLNEIRAMNAPGGLGHVFRQNAAARGQYSRLARQQFEAALRNNQG